MNWSLLNTINYYLSIRLDFFLVSCSSKPTDAGGMLSLSLYVHQPTSPATFGNGDESCPHDLTKLNRKILTSSCAQRALPVSRLRHAADSMLSRHQINGVRWALAGD